MSFKHVCVPAVVLGVALSFACKSTPKDPIPATAPAPVKVGEAHKVLDHLRYIAVRKDVKAAAALMPPTANVYGAAWWFHQHAGAMGQSLTEEQIKAAGLEQCKALGILIPGVAKKDLADAKAKLDAKKIDKMPENLATASEIALDMLPTDTDATRKEEYELLKGKAEALATTGIYRIAAAVPDEVWRAVTIQATKTNVADKNLTDVFIQYGDKLILQVTLGPSKDGNLGMVYAQFKVSSAQLKKAAEAEKAGSTK